MIPQMDFQLHTAMCQCSHCQSRRDAAVANETADVWRNGEQALFGIPTNSDPATVIRRMSLTDKITFFG